MTVLQITWKSCIVMGTSWFLFIQLNCLSSVFIMPVRVLHCVSKFVFYVLLKDKLSSVKLKQRLEIDDKSLFCNIDWGDVVWQCFSQGWEWWVRRCIGIEMQGVQSRGRPKTRLQSLVILVIMLSWTCFGTFTKPTVSVTFCVSVFRLCNFSFLTT